jgi:hypothetical protein
VGNPRTETVGAGISIRDTADELEIEIMRPRSGLVLLYESLIWLPPLVPLGFLAWIGLSPSGPTAPGMLLAVGLGLAAAALLYSVLAMMTYPAWAAVQKICLVDGIVRKQYPFGRVESVGAPIHLDLRRYLRSEAVVVRFKKDSKKPGYRPSFGNRVSLKCNGRTVLQFGPSLTLSEGRQIAERVNEHIQRWHIR